MRKILSVLTFVLLLSGCSVNIKNLETKLDESFEQTIENSDYENNNYRTGYSYYLPYEASVSERYLTNDILMINRHKVYFFTDLYSYLHNKDISYTIKNELVYDKQKQVNGEVITVNVYKDDKDYIMYVFNDYARLSTSCEIGYLPNLLNEMLVIISSIDIDKNLVSNQASLDDSAIYKETIDIFKSKVEKDNIIKTNEEN